jgi:molybdate transport system permease protein
MDWSPVWISLRVGVVSTALALTVGTVLAHWLAHSRSPLRRWLESAVLLPLVLPPTVLGYFLLVVLSRKSPIGKAWETLFGSPIVFTVNAAIVAACAATIPLVVRTLCAAFETTSSEILEAARIDGAHGIGLLLKIQLPLIRPHLVAAGTVAFARAVGDFGTTLMVAGSIPGETRTAAIAIYDLMNAGKDSQALMLVGVVSLLSLFALIVASRRTKAYN